MGISFDRVAEKYDTTRGYPEHVMEDILNALDSRLKPDDLILDAGMGTGRFAAPLQARDYRIVGIDIAGRMIRKAQEKGVENILLDAAINNPDERLAEMAVFGLREFKGIPATEKLLDLFKKTKSQRVKRAVLIALADEKGGVPVNVLVQVLKSETDADLRRIVIMALGQTKSDEAVPVLLEAARDKDSRLATAAVMALGEIGTPKAKAALMEIIEKKEPEKVKKDLPE